LTDGPAGVRVVLHEKHCTALINDNGVEMLAGIQSHRGRAVAIHVERANDGILRIRWIARPRLPAPDVADAIEIETSRPLDLAGQAGRVVAEPTGIGDRGRRTAGAAGGAA
jgi:hypothetical protein